MPRTKVSVVPVKPRSARMSGAFSRASPTKGAGEPVEDQFGNLVPVDEDDELDGTSNTSKARTHGWGGGMQLTVTRRLAERGNHFIVAGASVDGGLALRVRHRAGGPH